MAITLKEGLGGGYGEVGAGGDKADSESRDYNNKDTTYGVLTACPALF